MMLDVSIPAPTSEAAAAVMRGNRSRDTKPELALRRELHRRGWRYRLHERPEPNIRATADILFPPRRVAVFVDGCFWHGCPDHTRPVRSNQTYWREKIARNQERDLATTKRLEEAGWRVVRIWEHVPAHRAAEIVEAELLNRLSKSVR
jgi:DNA mismatch endonuclease (patch repair protein)